MGREAYHKILLSGCILPLVVFFGASFIVSCTENKPLDKQYLESENYTSFKKRTANEIKQNSKLNESFEWGFKQFVECEANHFSIPFDLDFKGIGSLSENLSKNCIAERNGESLKLLGESVTSNRLIRWMLLERETVYRDHELIVAIFQNQELKSFKTVGIFEKNPSRKISTNLEVVEERGETKISSRIHRNILYPIEQNNTVLSEYKINSTGGIEQL